MNTPLHLNIFLQRRHRVLNAVHTWILTGGSLALLGITAWVFGGMAALFYAVIFGGLTLYFTSRVSPAMVLRMYKARPVAPLEFPAGHRIIAELARRAGLTEIPKLYVVPSRLMNAFAVGRRSESAIAITDGLVQRLTQRELAGVLAHEMSHIANEDLRVMAFADMVSRYTSLMSTVGILSLLFNIGGFAAGTGTAVPWLAIAILLASPTIGSLLQLALSRTREFDADLGAVMLTGDPDGLALALNKLERMQGRIWENMVPGARIPDPSILRSHPSTSDRISRLMELKNARSGTRETTAPVTRRPSMVPRIRRNEFDYGPWVRSLEKSSEYPPLHDDDAEDPSSKTSLNSPDGPPRIRIRRGGGWW
jgi:heat shock protein HtpX